MDPADIIDEMSSKIVFKLEVPTTTIPSLIQVPDFPVMALDGNIYNYDVCF